MIQKETYYLLLMIDVANPETFKSITVLNEALLFLIKLNKTPKQSLPKILQKLIFRSFWLDEQYNLKLAV